MVFFPPENAIFEAGFVTSNESQLANIDPVHGKASCKRKPWKGHFEKTLFLLRNARHFIIKVKLFVEVEKKRINSYLMVCMVKSHQSASNAIYGTHQWNLNFRAFEAD